MPKKKSITSCRQYDDDFNAEAVQMLLDGHSAKSVASRFGLKSTYVLYRWKANLIAAGGHGTGEPGARLGERITSRVAGARNPKTSLGHFQPENIVQVYAVIVQLQKDGFTAAMLCEVLEVQRPCYYTWR